MISKRFSSSKKASKFSKRVLGMESLENRELLSINPLGYDGGDVVQTNQTFGSESNFELEGGTQVTVTAATGDAEGEIKVSFTATDTDSYLIQYRKGTSGTWSNFGAVTAVTTGNENVSKTIDSLDAGDSYQVRVLTVDSTNVAELTTALTDDNISSATNVVASDTKTATAKADDPTPPTPSAAVTNSVGSTSGVTSNAATVTWTKPTQYTPTTGDPVALKGAGSYTLKVTDGTDTFTFDAATVKTKTSWTVPGLKAGVEYTYTVTAELTAKNTSDTVPSGQQVVATGKFKTEAAGDAAKVTVGPPTDVKVAFTAKTSTYKVTWKAPANYTGGYKVIFNDGTSDKKTVEVKAGEKLQAEVAVADLTADKQHKITVVADVASGGAAISSTPTFVNVGTVTPAAATPPDSVLAANVASAALTETNISKGTAVAITGVADTSTNKIVGYYVATGATDPGTTDLSKFVYVARNSTSDTAVTTVNLAAAGTNVYVYGVGADGTLSAAAAEKTVTATGALAESDSTAAFATKPLAKADTTTKNKVTVSWTAGKDIEPTGDALKDGSVRYKIQGYNVSYRIKGSDTWISAAYVTGQSTATIPAIEGLAWATDYEFKVETVVKKGTYVLATTSWTDDSANTVSKNAVTATLKTAAAPVVAAPGKVEIDSVNTGTSMKVKWGAATGATGYTVTLRDANKAVLGTFTVASTVTNITFVKAATPSAAGELAFDLTPGMKYTVEVQAIGTIPGSVSKASSATLTAAAYPLATVKDAKETGITDLTVTVTAATKGITTDTPQNYYVEYTSVVDAKGKPDWNAAQVVSYATAVTGFLQGDPKAFKTGDKVKIEGLNPGTQYFVRTVAVDQVITGDGTPKTWADVTRVATGKEAKIKTVAVPLATISKSGYAMSGSDFGFKFSGKDPNMNDKKDDLRASTTFEYTLLVSAVSTVNKATGKLNGAEEITGVIITNGEDAKGNELFNSSIVKFSDLVTKGFKLEQLKSLNFQLEVKYKDGTDVYATTYTKVAKLALPKWFA